MVERPIKQAWSDAEGIGAVCSDGTIWWGVMRKQAVVWERIPGPPADPPEPVETLPIWAIVERYDLLTSPPQPRVVLGINHIIRERIDAAMTPSEARALARALIEAAGGSDGL